MKGPVSPDSPHALGAVGLEMDFRRILQPMADTEDTKLDAPFAASAAEGGIAAVPAAKRGRPRKIDAPAASVAAIASAAAVAPNPAAPGEAETPPAQPETAAGAAPSAEAPLAVAAKRGRKPKSASPVVVAKPAPVVTPRKLASPSVKPAAKVRAQTAILKPAILKPAILKPAAPKPMASKPAATHSAPVRAKPAVKRATVAAKPVAPRISAPIPAAGKAATSAPAYSPKPSHFPDLSSLKDTIMDMTPNFSGFQDAMSEAQAKAKAAFEKSTSMLGDFGEFAKGNVEAVIESGKIFADGLQDIGSTLALESRTAFEGLTSDVKELAAAKSPTDFLKAQSDIVRKNFDSAVAYGSKNSEAMLKLMSDVMAPLSGRVSLAVEKVRQSEVA